MTRAEMCELQIILNDLENTLKEMQKQKKWLPLKEFAQMINISHSTVQTFKDRAAFQQFTKYHPDGCLIKNCPEAVKLMRGYKYRNFEYEQELLRKKKKAVK